VDWSDQQAVSLPGGEETVLMHVNVQQSLCKKKKKKTFASLPPAGQLIQNCTELAEAQFVCRKLHLGLDESQKSWNGVVK